MHTSTTTRLDLDSQNENTTVIIPEIKHGDDPDYIVDAIARRLERAFVKRSVITLDAYVKRVKSQPSLNARLLNDTLVITSPRRINDDMIAFDCVYTIPHDARECLEVVGELFKPDNFDINFVIYDKDTRQGLLYCGLYLIEDSENGRVTRSVLEGVLPYFAILDEANAELKATA